MMHLEEALNGVQSVGISGHVKPDGDCVGSVMAVYNYIRSYFPEIQVNAYLEDIPEVFSFLENTEQISCHADEERYFDLFIVLDCGDIGRLGKNAGYFYKAKKTLCIDHHVNNQVLADADYIIPDASSTCELVFDILDADKITKAIAECLYVGIVHDTGVFQHSCATPKTMQTAGFLMGKGIDHSAIVAETFYQKTYRQNRLLGRAVLDSRLYLDGRCILTYLTQETMREFGCTTKDLEGIVDQLRITKGTQAAVFFYENTDGTYKVSLRASGNCNMAEAAASFGGGGHVKAAGCTMEGRVEDIIFRLLKAMEKALEAATETGL